MPGNALNVAGLDLSVLSGGENENAVRGEAVRAFANNLLDGTDAPRRSWTFTLYPMPLSDSATLRAAVGSGPVPCWGSLLTIPLEANAVDCKVTPKGGAFGPGVQSATDDWTEPSVSLSILIEEV